jgi:TolB protein
MTRTMLAAAVPVLLLAALGIAVSLLIGSTLYSREFTLEGLSSVSTGSRIYMTDLDRHITVRLPFHTTAADPHWSPDGDRLILTIYEGGPWRPYLLAAGQMRQLADLPDNVFHMRWSPDGEQIVFNWLRFDGSRLYISGPDGSDRRQLNADTVPEVYPQWSPDGQWIAYQRAAESGTVIVIVIVDAATGQQQITLQSGFFSFVSGTEAWSPQEPLLAFLALHPQAERYQLRIYDVRTNRIRTLADDAVTSNSLAWSPDGRRIAFPTTGNRIQIIDLEGREAPQFINLNLRPERVSWSPDGGTLLFMARDGTAYGFYTLDLNTSDPPVRVGPTLIDFDIPVWRP